MSLIDNSKVETALEALWQEFWVRRNESKIDKPEGLAKCLQAALGEQLTKKVMESLTSDSTKKQLSQKTDEAIADGAFGLPYFVAKNSKGQKETMHLEEAYGRAGKALG